MMDGITHAIATCDRIERGLTDAAGHAKHALAEMQIELQNMLDAINADRAAPAWPLWTSRCRGFPNKRATIQTFVVDHAIILAALVAAFAFSANGHSSGSTHPGVVQLPR
jgi:hypothetical protein